jgi:hypothetical protein
MNSFRDQPARLCRPALLLMCIAWATLHAADVSLELRRPELPPAVEGRSANPIDRIVGLYFERSGAAFPEAVDDAVFARRAYLDLWGLLPTPEQLREFERGSRSGKRERLVDTLLAGNQHYSEHWISFWNDLLRNDEGVEYWADTIGRKSISRWLLASLRDNMPYDRFVATLLNPVHADDPDGYLLGANWRGETSASQTPAMQAAQNSSQVFLGVNLKCNSCHDSFISNWKLKDAYGMAGFFSEQALDIYRCDVPTGEKARPGFLFSELGGVDANAPLGERRAAAVRLFTSSQNGRFPRTLVNRFWKKLMGRGLIEPIDVMDGEPWEPHLLEWLAADFVDHGYDLKHLLRRILTSQTYQLPAVAEKADAKSFVFRGPLVRKLTAEQFLDGVSSVTGEWRNFDPADGSDASPSRDWRLKLTPLGSALGRPFRDQVFTSRNEEPTTLQALELANGQTLAELLHDGARRMLGEPARPARNLFDSGEFRTETKTVNIQISGVSELRLLIRDAGSYDPSRVLAGWGQGELESPGGIVRLTDLKPRSDARTGVLNTKGSAYSNSVLAGTGSEIIYDIAGRGFTRFRAHVGVDQSTSQNDIGPKVRAFVFAQTPDPQRMVNVSGDPPVRLEAQPWTPLSLVTRIYRYALSKEPSEEEREVAEQFLKHPASRDKISVKGLEALLWAVFAHPEYHYIR